MELFKYLIVILIISLIILIVYFNDKIKTAFFDYYIEPFAVAQGTGEKIGLKWLYLGNSEPNGDKITNEKLYILLNYKWVSPIIINIDELDSLGIKNLTYDSYINVDDRYFKPYNVATDNVDIGLMWRDLGINTEKYVKGSYKEIKNDKIKNAIEVKAKNNLHEMIDGEKIISFTQKEYDVIKSTTPLTYDSYILIDGSNSGESGDTSKEEKRIYQPYYKHKIVKTDEIFTDINIDKILTKGFDNSFLKSSGIKTHNMKNDNYFNTEIYNNKGVSNNELHFNTESVNYRQSNDNSYKSILDPIDDNYLPSVSQTNNFNNDPKYMSEKTINQFVIIDIYKNILGRQPKPKEIIVNLQEFYEKNSDEEKLKLKLYNSTEYKMIVKMQSNDIDPTLVSKISEKNIIDMLKTIYKNHFNKMPHNKMTIPLKQCYIHLQFNDYLFKAMLMHDNYPNFERDILREYIINDEKLLEIFDNNFVLYELRLIANELKRRDMLKREALSTPVALTTDAAKNNPESSNSADTNLNAQKNIADIMKNSEPVFNINITLQDKNVSAPYGTLGTDSTDGIKVGATITTNNSLDPRNKSNTMKAFNPADPTVDLNIPNSRGVSSTTSNILTSNSSNYSINNANNANNANMIKGVNTRIGVGNGVGDTNIKAPVYSTDDLYDNTGNSRVVEYVDSYGEKHTQIMPDRIYEPINYKQQYRGDSAYRPNVCSYGTKQIVNPIYLSADGTDLREAIENTQVGSIMPKFAYREYEDVK